MVNVFQLSFSERLQAWHQLRQNLIHESLDQQCLMVDAWWQRAPFVNHYLHPQDTANWPDPWTLLAENHYCGIAKALGMCYTLWMIQQKPVEIAIATNNTEHLSAQHALVLVDQAKYILNYHPDTVLSNNLRDFTVIKTLDLTAARTKIK